MKNGKKKTDRNNEKTKKTPKIVKLDTTELARVYGGMMGTK